MSWSYSKFGNNIRPRSYGRKFYFSEKEIDFTTEHLDYSQFLLQEFFTADLETRDKLFLYYDFAYGSRSVNYLKRKYIEWANGNYHLSELIKDRILAFMPKHLNEASKHKLGIHEFMASIKNTVKSCQFDQNTTYKSTFNIKKPQDIIFIFESEYKKIQTLSIKNFRFNVLTDVEKEEALEISKYILKTKLQKVFDQIERDFNTFLPFMFKFNRGVFSASYSITAFNLKFDITNTGIEDIEIPKFQINEIEANSRFKEYSDKYLAYELISIHKEAKKAVCNSFLNKNDIQLFFAHYEDLLSGDSEVSMNSTFQGEGGVLSLKAQIKPIKLLKTSIIISSIKLFIYFIILISLISIAINYKLYTLLILGGLFVSIYSWYVISDEIIQLKTITKEYKSYGK